MIFDWSLLSYTCLTLGVLITSHSKLECIEQGPKDYLFWLFTFRILDYCLFVFWNLFSWNLFFEWHLEIKFKYPFLPHNKCDSFIHFKYFNEFFTHRLTRLKCLRQNAQGLDFGRGLECPVVTYWSDWVFRECETRDGPDGRGIHSRIAAQRTIEMKRKSNQKSNA